MNTRIANLMPSPCGAGTVLAVADTATAFAAGVFPQGTLYVMWQVQDAPIAVTYDGGAPAGSGPKYTLDIGAKGWWSIATAQALRTVRTTGVSGAIAATPFAD